MQSLKFISLKSQQANDKKANHVKLFFVVIRYWLIVHRSLEI